MLEVGQLGFFTVDFDEERRRLVFAYLDVSPHHRHVAGNDNKLERARKSVGRQRERSADASEFIRLQCL